MHISITDIRACIEECNFREAAKLALENSEVLSGHNNAESSDAWAELSLLLHDHQRQNGATLSQLSEAMREMAEVCASVRDVKLWFCAIFEKVVSASVSLPKPHSLFDGSSVSERLGRLQRCEDPSYVVDRMADDLHQIVETFLVLPKWSFHTEFSQIRKGSLHVLARARVEYFEAENEKHKTLVGLTTRARKLMAKIDTLQQLKARACGELEAKVREVEQSSNNRFNPTDFPPLRSGKSAG